MAHWISPKDQTSNSKEKTFYADTASDVANLPTAESEVAIGSACLVIATGDVYMLNSSRTWEVIGG